MLHNMNSALNAKCYVILHVEEVSMKWMDGPSVTEMERGGVYEMEIEMSSIHFCDTWSVHPFHIDRNSSKKIRIEIWTF